MPSRARASRSGSRKRSPISVALPQVAYALAASVAMARSATRVSRYPCSTQSSRWSSSSRRDRASQPPLWASSPRSSRRKASQKPQRAARAVSSRRSHSRCACPELIALVILARQVRGGRQPHEILGLKPRRVARGGELGIRLRPRLRIKGLPPPLQSAGHGHTLSRGTWHCTATTADRSRRLGDRSPDGRAGRWHDDNVALSISGPLLLGRAAGLARPGQRSSPPQPAYPPPRWCAGGSRRPAGRPPRPWPRRRPPRGRTAGRPRPARSSWPRRRRPPPGRPLPEHAPAGA